MKTRTVMAAHATLVACAALIFGAPVPLALLLGCVTAAAVSDATEQLIPNSVALAATVCAFAVWVSAGAPPTAALVAACAAAALLGLFELDGVGGGDVKTLPALVLAVSAVGVPELAPLRLALLAAVLCLGVIAWALTHRTAHGPVMAAAPLAAALALALG